jgi:hypothetical protein
MRTAHWKRTELLSVKMASLHQCNGNRFVRCTSLLLTQSGNLMDDVYAKNTSRFNRSSSRATKSTRRHLSSVISPRVSEACNMARAKQASKRKRRRIALPVLGAGVSLAIGGGASATAPAARLPSQETGPLPVITLGEEEISDVSLATFYVFDKENAGTSQLGPGVQLAAGCRGCGCRGCRGCAVRGCRGCGCAGCRGCAVIRGCGGCGGLWWGGCSCCWSWGACRNC